MSSTAETGLPRLNLVAIALGTAVIALSNWWLGGVDNPPGG